MVLSFLIWGAVSLGILSVNHHSHKWILCFETLVYITIENVRQAKWWYPCAHIAKKMFPKSRRSLANTQQHTATCHTWRGGRALRLLDLLWVCDTFTACKATAKLILKTPIDSASLRALPRDSRSSGSSGRSIRNWHQGWSTLDTPEASVSLACDWQLCSVKKCDIKTNIPIVWKVYSPS